MKNNPNLMPMLFCFFVILFTPALLKADTEDVYHSASGSGCGPAIGPTAAVDVDNDGVLDTYVVVYVITGQAFINSYTSSSYPYETTYRLELDPLSCTSDGYARIKIRFVNMLHPDFDTGNENTWVDKTLPALRIDGANMGPSTDVPAVFNIYAYRDINQTESIVPIYGNMTGGGTKVYSDPGGVREIVIRTSYVETISEDLILMATAPNTLQGTNVTADLDNGSVTFSSVTVPGNTFIVEEASSLPPPDDLAVCGPWPSPPYYSVKTNANTGSVENLCVNYPDTCQADGLAILIYRSICDPFGSCTNYWDDVTSSVDGGSQTICGDTRFSPFILARPIADGDGDGYTNQVDCNDDDDTVYPGATEDCDDQKDNDCDRHTDCLDSDCAADISCIECTDNDNDGFAVQGGACGLQDCDDNDPTVHPGVEEICDARDNDCNQATPDGTDEPWINTECDGPDSDDCREGVYICSGGIQECSDHSGNNVEICDYLDNDCDDLVDENVAITYYRDKDEDGFGNILESIKRCEAQPPAGYVSDNTDCDDEEAAINPQGTEVCDGVDNDCDRGVDEGFDQDNDYVADCFDNCPHVYNRGQDDSDGDGLGDACEDNDNDGWYDPVDNCPDVPNADQMDENNNDIGDDCEYDLSIERIEITQGIQDDNASVPLISGKNTWIRVYFDVGRAGVPLGPISGSIQFLTDEGLPNDPWINSVWEHGFVLSSLNSIIADPSLGPDETSSTLNFFIPKNWSWLAAPYIRISIRYNGSPADVNPWNNYYPDMALNYHYAPPLNLVFVPVRINDCYPSTNDFLRALYFVEETYPVSEINVWRSGILDFDGDPTTGDGIIAGDNEWLVTDIWFLNLFTDDPADNCHYMGQTCDCASFGCQGTIDGTAGSTWINSEEGWFMTGDPPTYGGSTMAHELGHNFGRSHTPDACNAPDTGSYPNYGSGLPRSSIGHFGFTGWTVYDPEETHDVMAYCRPRWISPYTYMAIYNRRSSESSGARHIEAADMDEQSYLVATGIIGADDSVEYKPFRQIMLPIGTDDGPGTGNYSLELQNENGLTLFIRYFEMRDLDLNLMRVQAFNEVFPYYPETETILLAHEDLVLARFIVSPNTPAVRIIYPNGGEALSGLEKLVWEAFDEDEDDLTYDVLYSTDNGETWSVIAMDLTQPGYEWDTDTSPGSDQALIKVLATDGVNTGQDESDLFFAVAEKRPEAYISFPEDNAEFFLNETIVFQGSAYDLEEGPLPTDSFSWSSSIDGDLASGRNISWNELSPGHHTITLAAQDSSGTIGTAEVMVNISGDQDSDGDRIGDDEDNCPFFSNANQTDVDGDEIGDVCDDDDFDSDGIPDAIDNCPEISNNQRDSDSDRIGDACDNCPTVPNVDQADADGDGIGDACTCEGNYDNDSDVDGQDLGFLAMDYTMPELEQFADYFGRMDCSELDRPCSGELRYDTGSPGWHWAVNQDYGIAVRFTPPVYPWTIDGADFWPWSNSESLDIEVHIWDDNGIEGLPGTDLITPFFHSCTSVDSWERITLPVTTIYDGEFYIGWVQKSTLLYYNGRDDAPSYEGRSYAKYPDGSWINFSDLDITDNIMIRQGCQVSP